jgi:formate hydrogenlyase transcriptional activator
LSRRAYAEIERLRAETAIKEDEEQLASILGSTMDAIITFDASRTIELFNHAAEKIFRCSAGQVIGRALDPFLTDAFRLVIQQSISNSDSNAGGAFVWAPGGLSARRAGGEEFPVEATISQAGVRGRRLYTLILRDVTSAGALKKRFANSASRTSTFRRRSRQRTISARS